jgi:uncharacterized membrane protein YhaH (DUF805 family)
MEFVAYYASLVQQDIVAKPAGFADRVAARLIGATAWYMPHDPEPYWATWIKRVVFPILLLATLILIASRRRLDRQATAAIAITALALVPYILVSYYERYAMPLVGMKMIIVLHAIRCPIAANLAQGMQRAKQKNSPRVSDER